MKNFHTHYDNLKVSRSAPTEVIRAAYRVLAQKYHPDRNPGDSEAARIMKTINASYEVLSDPVKRQEHDQWVAQQELMQEQAEFSSRQPQRAPPPPSGSVGQASSAPRGNKSKAAATLWGAFLGGFGAHKFYMGSWGWGIVYLLTCWLYIPIIVALVEWIRYVLMSDDEFYGKVADFQSQNPGPFSFFW